MGGREGKSITVSAIISRTSSPVGYRVIKQFCTHLWAAPLVCVGGVGRRYGDA